MIESKVVPEYKNTVTCKTLAYHKLSFFNQTINCIGPDQRRVQNIQELLIGSHKYSKHEGLAKQHSLVELIL